MQLLADHRILLKVSRGRASRLGDFKPGLSGQAHRITVNGDLNIYAFQLVFLHELAHLLVWENTRGRTPPHGEEWKQAFGALIRDFLGRGLFHPSTRDTLWSYSHKVRATGIACEGVVRELSLFDREAASDPLVFLEEVPLESLFYTRTGRLFRKDQKLRKRFRCHCLDNQRAYLFHPLARVRPAGRAKGGDRPHENASTVKIFLKQQP
jgi:hypothetical protein